MPPESFIDPDYPIKQSAGYMFVQLFVIQLIFMVIYALLVFIGDETSSIRTLPFFNISAADIVLIITGIILNFVFFVIAFIVWQSNEYRVTNKHLFVTRNLLMFRSELFVELNAIDHVMVRESFVGNLFNYGTVLVYLKHPHRRPIKLNGMPYPHQISSYLKAKMSAWHANRSAHKR
jgi:hypothetical protein